MANIACQRPALPSASESSCSMLYTRGSADQNATSLRNKRVPRCWHRRRVAGACLARAGHREPKKLRSRSADLSQPQAPVLWYLESTCGLPCVLHLRSIASHGDCRSAAGLYQALSSLPWLLLEILPRLPLPCPSDDASAAKAPGAALPSVHAQRQFIRSARSGSASRAALCSPAVGLGVRKLSRLVQACHRTQEEEAESTG